MKLHGLVLVVLSMSMTATAQEAGDGGRYKLKRDADFSSLYPRSGAVAEGALPFDKSYGEFTPAQQNRIKMDYVALAEGDEPPFPLQGLGALYRPVSKAQQKLLASGDFRADAEIDQEGNVVAVAVRQSPSEQVTKFMANILLLTKFKPAVCRGQPCQMGFPVNVTFEVE
jgi:hypothetical protein